MFSSLYSPFFTSGLLSQPITYPDSPDMSTSPPRRGSLPSEGTSSKRARESRRDEASAYYVALQPRRDETEFRSFLSLDLAESQSMRSASLKHFRRRKPAPPVPALPPVCTVSPLRTHFSRDSLRSIPSPKPAPSITLPDLPSALPATAPAALSHFSASPPRLPSLPVLPALEISITTTSHATRQSARPPPPPPTPPPASVPPKPLVWKPIVRHFSVATRASTSTVSTRVRRFNRSEALAALEGRRRRFAPIAELPAWRRASPSGTRRNLVPNFMNMSDDDDDEDLPMADADADADDEMADDDDLDFAAIISDEADPWGFNPILEPEDIVLPSSPGFLESPRKAPSPPPSRLTKLPFSPLLHHPYHPQTVAYTVLGPSARTNSNRKSKPSSSQRQRRNHSQHRNNTNPSSKRRPTKKEPLGLTSFIDLHNDDDNSIPRSNPSSNARSSTSWSWQSFVHIAHVS